MGSWSTSSTPGSAISGSTLSTSPIRRSAPPCCCSSCSRSGRHWRARTRRRRRMPAPPTIEIGWRMPERSPVAVGPRVLHVPDGAAIQRVDRYVADATGLSRSYVQKLITDGRVTRGEHPLRARDLVGPGETVRVDVPEATTPDLEPDAGIELRVVHQDDDLLIVDKPAGLVVHPAPGHASGTLVNALLARGGDYGGIAGVRRP